ncbi:hypothetical protein HDV01_000324 [Terramyces sp. JEL0728]|nr:hypothetical protein HDV01_000324 [Terramyces sp. JEL0728]
MSAFLNKKWIKEELLDEVNRVVQEVQVKKTDMDTIGSRFSLIEQSGYRAQIIKVASVYDPETKETRLIISDKDHAINARIHGEKIVLDILDFEIVTNQNVSILGHPQDLNYTHEVNQIIAKIKECIVPKPVHFAWGEFTPDCMAETIGKVQETVDQDKEDDQYQDKDILDILASIATLDDSQTANTPTAKPQEQLDEDFVQAQVEIEKDQIEFQQIVEPPIEVREDPEVASQTQYPVNVNNFKHTKLEVFANIMPQINHHSSQSSEPEENVEGDQELLPDNAELNETSTVNIDDDIQTQDGSNDDEEECEMHESLSYGEIAIDIDEPGNQNAERIDDKNLETNGPFVNEIDNKVSKLPKDKTTAVTEEQTDHYDLFSTQNHDDESEMAVDVEIEEDRDLIEKAYQEFEDSNDDDSMDAEFITQPQDEHVHNDPFDRSGIVIEADEGDDQDRCSPTASDIEYQEFFTNIASDLSLSKFSMTPAISKDEMSLKKANLEFEHPEKAAPTLNTVENKEDLIYASDEEFRIVKRNQTGELEIQSSPFKDIDYSGIYRRASSGRLMKDDEAEITGNNNEDSTEVQSPDKNNFYFTAIYSETEEQLNYIQQSEAGSEVVIPVIESAELLESETRLRRIPIQEQFSEELKGDKMQMYGNECKYIITTAPIEDVLILEDVEPLQFEKESDIENLDSHNSEMSTLDSNSEGQNEEKNINKDRSDVVAVEVSSGESESVPSETELADIGTKDNQLIQHDLEDRKEFEELLDNYFVKENLTKGTVELSTPDYNTEFEPPASRAIGAYSAILDKEPVEMDNAQIKGTEFDQTKVQIAGETPIENELDNIFDRNQDNGMEFSELEHENEADVGMEDSPKGIQSFTEPISNKKSPGLDVCDPPSDEFDHEYRSNYLDRDVNASFSSLPVAHSFESGQKFNSNGPSIVSPCSKPSPDDMTQSLTTPNISKYTPLAIFDKLQSKKHKRARIFSSPLKLADSPERRLFSLPNTPINYSPAKQPHSFDRSQKNNAASPNPIENISVTNYSTPTHQSHSSSTFNSVRKIIINRTTPTIVSTNAAIENQQVLPPLQSKQSDKDISALASSKKRKVDDQLSKIARRKTWHPDSLEKSTGSANKPSIFQATVQKLTSFGELLKEKVKERKSLRK